MAQQTQEAHQVIQQERHRRVQAEQIVDVLVPMTQSEIIHVPHEQEELARVPVVQIQERIVQNPGRNLDTAKHLENETSSATMQSALARKDQFVFGQAPQVEPNIAPTKLPFVRMKSEPGTYDISGGSDMEEVQVSAVSKKVAKQVEDFAGKHGLDDKAKSRLAHASTDEMAEEVVSRALCP